MRRTRIWQYCLCRHDEQASKSKDWDAHFRTSAAVRQRCKSWVRVIVELFDHGQKNIIVSFASSILAFGTRLPSCLVAKQNRLARRIDCSAEALLRPSLAAARRGLQPTQLVRFAWIDPSVGKTNCDAVVGCPREGTHRRTEEYGQGSVRNDQASESHCHLLVHSFPVLSLLTSKNTTCWLRCTAR